MSEKDLAKLKAEHEQACESEAVSTLDTCIIGIEYIVELEKEIAALKAEREVLAEGWIVDADLRVFCDENPLEVYAESEPETVGREIPVSIIRREVKV